MRLRRGFYPRRPWAGRARVGGGAWLLVGLAGCQGSQSALSAAGVEAAEVARLFWLMAISAGLIWLLVIGLSLIARRADPGRFGPHSFRWIIIGGGVLVPVVVLGALLAYGLSLTPGRQSDGDGLRVEVSGEQWWWRVRYLPRAGAPVDGANEIRLPADERVEFLLRSPDVIHSLWIPSLGGKLDMIPGRITRMVLQPTQAGTYRGACAEYCGASHALMAFPVVVMPPAAFADWLRARAAQPRPPADELARRGRDLFLANGCGGCHRIRGIGPAAAGSIGPDLTHVGGRLSLGAGLRLE